MGARRTTKVIAIATGFFVILVGTALLISSETKPGSPPTLPIAFVGYTNDARGARLAMFAVTNVHSRKIDYSAAVEFKVQGEWQHLAQPWPPAFSVAPRQGSTFTVTNPIEGTWRVSLMYQKTPTKRDEAGFRIRRFLDRFKLYALAKRVPTEKFKAYTVYSSERTD